MHVLRFPIRSFFLPQDVHSRSKGLEALLQDGGCPLGLAAAAHGAEAAEAMAQAAAAAGAPGPGGCGGRQGTQEAFSLLAMQRG